MHPISFFRFSKRKTNKTTKTTTTTTKFNPTFIDQDLTSSSSTTVPPPPYGLNYITIPYESIPYELNLHLLTKLEDFNREEEQFEGEIKKLTSNDFFLKEMEVNNELLCDWNEEKLDLKDALIDLSYKTNNNYSDSCSKKESYRNYTPEPKTQSNYFNCCTIC